MKSPRLPRYSTVMLRFAAMIFIAAHAAAAAEQPANIAPPSPPSAPTSLGTATVPLRAFSALGASFIEANHLAELGWSQAQIEAFVDGVRAGFQGKTYEFDEAAKLLGAETSQKLQELATRRARPSAASSVHLDQAIKDARKRLGLQQSASGLGHRVTTTSNAGVRPGPHDTVVISFTATTADGTNLPQFTADRSRGRVEDLLPGLAEGIQMMTVGSQAIFLLPPSLSFGETDWPDGIEPNTLLIFTVTLHDVASSVRAP